MSCEQSRIRVCHCFGIFIALAGMSRTCDQVVNHTLFHTCRRGTELNWKREGSDQVFLWFLANLLNFI